MTANEWKQPADLFEKAPTSFEKAGIESSNREGCLCDSCGGVVVTIALGGDDRPQLRLRPESQGRGHIRISCEGGSKPAHTSPRRQVCGAGPGTAFGSPKINIICGGCGASLMRFEGGSCD